MALVCLYHALRYLRLPNIEPLTSTQHAAAARTQCPLCFFLLTRCNQQRSICPLSARRYIITRSSCHSRDVPCSRIHATVQPVPGLAWFSALYRQILNKQEEVASNRLAFIFHCNCWRMWRLLLGVLLGSAGCLVVTGGGTAASDGSCSSEKGVQLVGYNMYVTQASKSTQAVNGIIFYTPQDRTPRYRSCLYYTHCCDRESCCPSVQAMSGSIV